MVGLEENVLRKIAGLEEKVQRRWLDWRNRC